MKPDGVLYEDWRGHCRETGGGTVGRLEAVLYRD